MLRAARVHENRRAQFFETEYNFSLDDSSRRVANRDYNGVAFPRNPPRNKTASVELARRLFLRRGFLLPGKMTAGLPTFFCLASDAQIEVAIISRRYTVFIHLCLSSS